MASVAPPRIPDSLLQIMERAKDTAVSPEELVRDVHRAWKEAGGLVGGKPRHSDRFMGEQLVAAGRPIRSLTPKLNGRTRIRSADAEALLRHMLSHWPRPRPDRPDEVDHVAIEGDEVEALVEEIAGRIDTFDAATEVAGDEGAPGEVSLPGENSADLIVSEFESSCALFTVATDTAVVAQSPTENLIGFVDLMNRLRSVDQRSSTTRALIWIVNRGKLRFDDQESRLQYLSMHNLMTRINAVKHFKDRESLECWKWLRERSCFIVWDVTSSEITSFEGLSRPEFEAKDLLLANPIHWMKEENFKILYGQNLERLAQRNFTVFLKFANKKDELEYRNDQGSYHYFGYASFNKNGRVVPRGMSLPSPGPNYEAALRTAYSAAVEVLQLKQKNMWGVPTDGLMAKMQLAYLGFRVLSIDKFLQLDK